MVKYSSILLKSANVIFWGKHMKTVLNNISSTKSFWLILFTKIIFIYLYVPVEANYVILPFLKSFVINHSNPWDFLSMNETIIDFPFSSGILYILSLMTFPILIDQDLNHFGHFAIQIPTLLADLLIFFLLVKQFPSKIKHIILLYFLSPIIFISSYIHLNFDLLAVAILYFSIYLLIKEKHVLSAILMGLSLATKSPVIFALPLVLIFIYKRNTFSQLFKYSAILAASSILLVLPFANSSSFQQLVLFNPDQLKILDLHIKLGNSNIYLAPLFLSLLYIQFLRYQKINIDLLWTYLGIVYFSFVILIPPLPTWYAWSFVFASLYFIATWGAKRNNYLFVGLISLYTLYFGLNSEFLDSQISDLLNSDSIQLNKWIDLTFTLFQGVLIFTTFNLFKYGSFSNSIYKQNKKPMILGIGGDSGVGKTTLSNSITTMFGENRVLVIEGDGDHKWERNHEKWSEFTHLNPKANNLHQQTQIIEQLRDGNVARRAEYNHETGQFTHSKTINPNDFVILCGLHPFYLPKTRKMIDLKIYIDTDEGLRTHWKILRDCNERGYTLSKVIDQLNSRIEDAKKYIYPQKQYADLIISQTPVQPFEPGSSTENIQTKLKLTIDANISLDNIVASFELQNIKFNHDYDINLEHQFLEIETPISPDFISSIANDCIPNLSEITKNRDVEWGADYDAITQLIILILISNKLKGGSTFEI
jgi:uridine kinase